MSVANWGLAELQNRSQSLFAKIAAKFLGAKPAPPAVTDAMNVSARATFLAGSAMHAVPEFMRLSGNGTASVAVQLVRDLGHQPLCDELRHVVVTEGPAAAALLTPEVEAASSAVRYTGRSMKTDDSKMNHPKPVWSQVGPSF